MASSLFARKLVSLLLKEMGGRAGLRPVLGAIQLTSLGIGAIIGAGIFVVIGLVAKDKAGGAIIDLPVLLIAGLITTVLVIGIRESATFNAFMVAVKLAIVLLIIAVGVFYIDPNNWHPFAPYGYSGVSFFGTTILGQHGAGGEPL